MFLILSSQNYEEVGTLPAYEKKGEKKVLRPSADVRGWLLHLATDLHKYIKLC